MFGLKTSNTAVVACALLFLLGSSSACREYENCSRDADCPDGSVCWLNTRGEAPLRTCVPSSYLIETGQMDAGAPDAAGGDEGPLNDAGSGDIGETGPDLDEGEVTDEPDLAPGAPPAPTGVVASDGTSSGHVSISWNAAARAQTYRLLRDGVEVASGIAETAYDDGGAGAARPTNAGFELTASDGSRSDLVVVTWSAPDVPNGEVHEYRVIAENAAGTGPASQPDTGFRAPAPPTRYELQIAGGEWISVGASRVYEDSSAPPGFVDVGEALASDGTSPYEVELSVTALEAVAGEPRSYRVRAVNAAGAGPASSDETGFRAAPAFDLQWERSLDGPDTGFEDVVGATAAADVDTSGPPGDRERWYRLRVDVEGESDYSSSDAGSRQVVRLVGSATGALDGFGWAVAVAQDVLVVGARFEIVGEHGRLGAAYVFRHSEPDGWQEEERLTPADSSEAGFGSDVALSPDASVAAIGTPWASNANGQAAGQVAVYYDSESHGWQKEVVLAHDGQPLDHFGMAVDLSDDALLVAAPDSAHNDVDSGKVYVFGDLPGPFFDRAVIAPSDPAAFENFGWSAAISDSGSVILVGAPFAGGDFGRVIAFHRVSEPTSHWQQIGALPNPTPVGSDYFGGSVAIDGQRLFARHGLPGSEVEASPGPVYVYAEVGGAYELDASLRSAPDSNVLAVFAVEDGVLCAMTREEEPTIWTFHLEGDTWGEGREIGLSEVPSNVRELAVSGGWLVIGAFEDSTAGDGAGAVLAIWLGT